MSADLSSLSPPPLSASRRGGRLLLAALGLMLVMALGAAGYLQSRQHELLKAANNSQDDYLVWSLFQFEAEFLKLRLAMEQAAGPSMAVDAEGLAQRYEIFVSRLGITESEEAAKILQNHPDYRRTLARCKAFAQWADALPLNAALVREQPQLLREAIERMDGLAEAIHELSLTASHHVAAQVTERNELVRRQNQLSLWLTLLECALILGLAAVVFRQFRGLDKASGQQSALTRSLEDAQREAEAGSAAKNAFLAHVSHELHTPMHGLLGMLAMLKDSDLSGTQKAQLQVAADSADQLAGALNDILDVSRMQAGGIGIRAEPLHLGRLARELEALFWPLASNKGLDLNIRLEDDLPTWVSADPARLRQILLNLLSNAIKFSDRGRVALHLSRQSDALGKELLRFEVSDTGMGMDAATQARLFQRFSPGDASSSRRFSGIGLGLEISRKLARAMGGDIFVASEPGRGSVFTLELQLPACAAPPPAPNPTPDTQPQQRKLKVLVSEDQPTNRAFMEVLLEKLGHTAVFCENGLETLQRLKVEDFDLILMDLHTPMMDGYQATQAIRALPAPKSDIKIVALSADSFDESRDKALKVGMDDFLAKPVNIRALTVMLEAQARKLGARA